MEFSGRTESERCNTLRNDFQDHLLNGDLLRSNVTKHFPWFGPPLLAVNAEQLRLIADVVLPRGNVLVYQCRIAAAQHNDIKVSVRYRLRLVADHRPQTDRLGKQGGKTDACVHLIVGERYRTAKLVTVLPVQIEDVDAVALDRVTVRLELARVAMLVPRLYMQEGWCTGTAHDRTGRANQARSARIHWTRCERFDERTARDMARTDQDRNFVLTGGPHGKLNLRYVGIVRIGRRTEFADRDDLARTLGNFDEELIRITDGIGLTVALMEPHGKAHRTADPGRIGPVPVYLTVGRQQILPGHVLEQRMASFRCERWLCHGGKRNQSGDRYRHDQHAAPGPRILVLARLHHRGPQVGF
uniref:Uncharacterized protein n=1 Tax=Anopheles christyi TaxID=43041 RepID=A0A182KIU5_9DIPT